MRELEDCFHAINRPNVCSTSSNMFSSKGDNSYCAQMSDERKGTLKMAGGGDLGQVTLTLLLYLVIHDSLGSMYLTWSNSTVQT